MQEQEQEKQKGRMLSVHRTILTMFACVALSVQEHFRLSEVRAITELASATQYRFLQALVAEGWLEYHREDGDSGTYSLPRKSAEHQTYARIYARYMLGEQQTA